VKTVTITLFFTFLKNLEPYIAMLSHVVVVYCYSVIHDWRNSVHDEVAINNAGFWYKMLLFKHAVAIDYILSLSHKLSDPMFEFNESKPIRLLTVLVF